VTLKDLPVRFNQFTSTNSKFNNSTRDSNQWRGVPVMPSDERVDRRI